MIFHILVNKLVNDAWYIYSIMKMELQKSICGYSTTCMLLNQVVIVPSPDGRDIKYESQVFNSDMSFKIEVPYCSRCCMLDIGPISGYNKQDIQSLYFISYR